MNKDVRRRAKVPPKSASTKTDAVKPKSDSTKTDETGSLGLAFMI